MMPFVSKDNGRLDVCVGLEVRAEQEPLRKSALGGYDSTAEHSSTATGPECKVVTSSKNCLLLDNDNLSG